jgi:hypothetical protein
VDELKKISVMLMFLIESKVACGLFILILRVPISYPEDLPSRGAILPDACLASRSLTRRSQHLGFADSSNRYVKIRHGFGGKARCALRRKGCSPPSSRYTDSNRDSKMRRRSPASPTSCSQNLNISITSITASRPPSGFSPAARGERAAAKRTRALRVHD